MMQAELLAAFGGGPLKLERRTPHLSAVAEEAEQAGSAEAPNFKDYGPVQPVAEHPPSSSLVSTQDVVSPHATGASVIRQHSLTASVLSLPAATAPLVLSTKVCSVRRPS